MEESTMQELDSWNAAFIKTSSDSNEAAFMDFLPSWNDIFLEQNGSEEAFMQITELSNKGGDGIGIHDCPLGVEDFMLYDDMFSDLSEDLLMDVIDKLPNDSEGILVDSDYSARHKSSISSETGSADTSAYLECDWSATALIPCSIDSEEYRGLRLVHLLTACAEAISDGGHDLVKIILCRLKELVSPTGSTMQRVAYYLSQSLQQRHHSSGHMEEHMCRSYDRFKDPNYMGAFTLLNQVYPYIRFAHFTANQSIVEAIPGDAQKVHIIDFDIVEGMQWPPLMETLVSEIHKIVHLKITAVKWDDDDDDPGPFPRCCQDTGRRLSEYASSLGIPFSFQETELENLKEMLSSNEEEIVIVNCMWELPHMMERSRKQLIEFINGARHLNPAILIVGSGHNGIVTHQNLNFSEHFPECLKNLCAVFDSLEAGLEEQYGLARAMVERLFMGPTMCRPINYISKDEQKELVRVGNIPLKYGFTEGDISNKNVMYAKYIVGQVKEYVTEIVGSNELVLMWQSTPLTGVSTWRPTSFV